MSRTVDDVCHIPFVNQYVSVWVNLSVCQLLVLIDILWLLPEGVGEEGEEGGGGWMMVMMFGRTDWSRDHG